MRRASVLILLFILLVSLRSATLSLREAKAGGSIYIRAGGNIDPPTANITTTDNVVYTFTDNNFDSLVIERDHIVVDGNGFRLQGTGNGTESGTGITLSGRVNVTVQSIHIDAFDHGVDLRDAFNNTISGSNITDNHLYGVYLVDSSNNTISDNNLAENWCDVYLFNSPGNTVSGNDIADRHYGIILDSSSRNTVSGNIFVGDGLLIRSSYRNVVEDNTINDKPLVYLEDASNQTVAEAGQVILVNSEHIRVENLTISHTGCGIELFNTTHALVTGNNLSDNLEGVVFFYSFNNTVSDNNIANNYADAIHLSHSSDNTISGNNITADNYWGVNLYSSSGNTVVGNTIADNYDAGVHLSHSSSNTIACNNITASEYDGLSLYQSSGNTIAGNNIANNRHGVVLSSSSNNSIHHNNFIDNNIQEIHYGSTINTWDDGYPSGGNCWSDYIGSDVKSGPFQNQPGSDGIGDSPYVINSNNLDPYPLMKPYPWGPHDIGITSLDASKTVVGQGYAVHINVTIFNYGNNTEYFNATVYVNTTIIHTAEDLVLSSKSSTTVTFTWNTTGWANGNYTLSAMVDTVPGETDTVDNAFDRGIFVTLAGDVDENRQVNIFDIVRMAGVYGVSLPDPRYIPNCDIDGDGDIDIFDIVIAAGNYGQSW